MKILIFAAFMALAAGMARADQITVFAASSLKTALDRIAAEWSAGSGVDVALSYDGSARLAQQILQGAPAELFIAAAPEWMDAAEAALQPGTRRDILGNDLVLIGVGAPAAQALSADLDLGALLGPGRLAMGQAGSVPVGLYGRQALTALGLWDAVQGRLAEVDSARAVLDLVARGEAPLGIVFGSDLRAAQEAGLDIGLIGRFDPASHAPIRYPAALVAGAGPQAAAFLAHLASPQARAIFDDQGFTVLTP